MSASNIQLVTLRHHLIIFLPLSRSECGPNLSPPFSPFFLEIQHFVHVLSSCFSWHLISTTAVLKEHIWTQILEAMGKWPWLLLSALYIILVFLSLLITHSKIYKLSSVLLNSHWLLVMPLFEVIYEFILFFPVRRMKQALHLIHLLQFGSIIGIMNCSRDCKTIALCLLFY